MKRRRYLRKRWITLTVPLIALIGWFIYQDPDIGPQAQNIQDAGRSQVPPLPPRERTASEALLAGYGTEGEPIEDLRKVHHVITGYFSVIKDPVRFPIGGNADLAAALRGENPNREVFLPPDHPVFSAEGLLVDRWGAPLVVHPEGWRQIGLRSAGPDGKPYTEDDLVLTPAGIRP